MKIGEPYIRKKGNKAIIEVKVDAKTIFIKTLPDTRTLIELITGQASQTYIENKVKESLKASQDVERPVEIEEEKDAEDAEVRLIKITRTFEKDAESPKIEEEELLEGEITEAEIEEGKRRVNELMKEVLPQRSSDHSKLE